ncbi:hypothetical protein SASPL_100074 [Salvia splendens]|uniref:Uncharacterized protein n=1 Tax=Salvia splendens TaxID=180675 RepID=A0A8X8YPD2_SALSN|nr:hypothetical protein SASPL_100074 [Salvia splendens]
MKNHQITLDQEGEPKPASMPITVFNDFNVLQRVGSGAAQSGFGLSGPVQDSSQMEVSIKLESTTDLWDLTSLDLSFDHRFARMSSLVLMSCSMSNFMTSLGSMESNEIVPNMAALGILVLIVAGNIVIHTIQMRSSGSMLYFVLPQQVTSSVIMLLFLVTFSLVLVEARFGKNSLENLEARLVQQDSLDTNNDVVFLASNYDWSIGWILNVQCIGVAVGTIAPLLRRLAASWFKISETEQRSFRDELKFEKYWTWRLVEWRDRSLPFQVQNRVCRKLLRDAVRFVMQEVAS